MDDDKKYMYRCLYLASLGHGFVSPNPLVGAVLVYNNVIIGEGYHKKFGEAHAEVNCINNVLPANQHLIKDSTLYVNLEPCNHFGKTPPCTHLIVKSEIKKVVVGCVDNFSKVNGTGITYLQQNGIAVITPVLEEACKALNKFFYNFNSTHKPYIILKYAQTINGYIGNKHNNRLLISNTTTNFLTDHWRQQVDGILVGKNTVNKDNPKLTTKFYNKYKQIRLFVDNNLEVDLQKSVLDGSATTIIFNTKKNSTEGNNLYVQYDGTNLYQALITVCQQYKIQSIMVEGGAQLLQYFINNNFFNECLVITNNQLEVQEGIKSPVLKNVILTSSQKIHNDTIFFYANANH